MSHVMEETFRARQGAREWSFGHAGMTVRARRTAEGERNRMNGVVPPDHRASSTGTCVGEVGVRPSPLRDENANTTSCQRPVRFAHAPGPLICDVRRRNRLMMKNQ